MSRAPELLYIAINLFSTNELVNKQSIDNGKCYRKGALELG